jgi:maltooligosyltrehalose trehalohydrolase
MTRHAFALPLGAELIAPECTRFRLWAPSAESVELVLADGRSAPMPRDSQGVASIEFACGAGTRYRYRIDCRLLVPDPASRQQADDADGDSIVLDPREYAWQCSHWHGRPWPQSVIYELHVGCCGGFEGVAAQLPRLAGLGITAVELMPIADFTGTRNWGYDGVLPFAPDSSYGSPAALKALIDRAHALGLCIYLDVVYNHFGPDGNFLQHYAAPFFDPGKQSPWGPAIDFDRAEVAEFFTANALYWLLEYRFDGLRFDAVHAISQPAWLDRTASAVRAAIEPGRHVHLMLENEHNTVSHLQHGFDAQWNDDGHNALHVLLTGENEGYYRNYHPRPIEHLARVLAEGLAYQGELPPAWPERGPRGEPSGHLPPYRFVLFLQNHDQIGNRAAGERLIQLIDAESLRAAIVLQLMCPQVPLIFMGEEWGSRQPFQFFTDFHDALGDAVREGRRREFAGFAAFADDAARQRIPDPNDPATFERSIPDFAHADDGGGHASWGGFYRELLGLRRRLLVPHLSQMQSAGVDVLGERALVARWHFGSQGRLSIAANFADAPIAIPELPGFALAESRDGIASAAAAGELLPRACAAFLRGER